MNHEAAQLLATILQLPEPPFQDVSMDNCAQWTSLKHIEIIMTFEEKYNVQFDLADIPKLTSQQALLAKLEELLNAGA